MLSDWVPESEPDTNTGSDTTGNAYRTITMPEPPSPPAADIYADAAPLQ
jgi:hypothetical protein